MIDSKLRKYFQVTCIDPVVQHKFFNKIHPNVLTFLACIFGALVPIFLILQLTLFSFICLCFSGFLDLLDGSLARLRNIASSNGAVLDIVSDRIVEFLIIMGLYAVDPESRAAYALVMLGSVLICVTSFLVVGMFSENKGEKSFHYSPGIMERTEAFICFALMILFPKGFIGLSVTFSLLVFLTAVLRVYQLFASSKKIQSK